MSENKSITPEQPREMAGVSPEIPRELLENILESAREIEPRMKEWYKDFHENPELGGEEIRTARNVVDHLRSLGIEIMGEKIGALRGKEGTGVVALIKGEETGPTVALRADMDALPLQEPEDHLPRSQKNGVMHGCGHDAHTAALIGAAKILKDLAIKGELPGNVVLVFQPSEEKSHEKESGAVRMIRFLQKSGLREKTGAFFGLHVRADMERGRINIKEGIQMASSGEVDIILKGPGGHIMNAYELPNLHLIFSEITAKLSNTFRELDKQKKALVASARTIYSGSGYNVLPAEANSTWVVRVASSLYKEISSEIIDDIRGVVSQIVEKYAPAGEVKIEIKPRPGYRPVIHRSQELVDIAAKTAQKIVKECKRSEELEMGGEDFSFYLEKLQGKEIPGVFLMVGAANTAKGIPPVPHHSPEFRIDPEVMKDLAALYAVFSAEAMLHLKK